MPSGGGLQITANEAVADVGALPELVRTQVAEAAEVCASISDRGGEMDLVTGAFSYSGSRIAELLIESGREVRTLTHHPDREHPLQGQVRALPYRFDDP